MKIGTENRAVVPFGTVSTLRRTRSVGHSWCFSSSQIALTYGSCNFENFHNINRAHKSRNAIAFMRFSVRIVSYRIVLYCVGAEREKVRGYCRKTNEARILKTCFRLFSSYTEFTNDGWPGVSERPSMESRRFRIVAEGKMKTWLFCMWFCPCRGQYPVPGPFLDGRNLSELVMKNYELNLLAFYAAVVSLNFILLAVSLYRLIYLLIRCSSIFFNFSPDIIYAYPFVFLNPLELKATPAKERIVFLLSWYNLLYTNRKRANLYLYKDDSCLDM